MKGCAAVVVVVLMLGLGVAGFTWESDSCTVSFGSHNMSLTVQGWGSKGVCQQMKGGGENAFAKILAIATLGIADVHVHDGSPSGDVICEGWDGYQRYTVRDHGLTGLNLMGKLFCSTLQSAKAT